MLLVWLDHWFLLSATLVNNTLLSCPHLSVSIYCLFYTKNTSITSPCWICVVLSTVELWSRTGLQGMTAIQITDKNTNNNLLFCDTFSSPWYMYNSLCWLIAHDCLSYSSFGKYLERCINEVLMCVTWRKRPYVSAFHILYGIYRV